ncbi:MAG: DUF4865 family protein [Pseudomonas sp.]|uniref:DUF4865 family protein n=1 Tax=Pseudomonas abieticivorans TaxID=2931382 RepID=UPI0020BF763D|nr:DUF4865 family protein [Pseudomonas sp. PIA16]MDE1167844.1 DUF4865 family protein [Pseudomonas sp.]
MIALQYTIELADDYDMAQIASRVGAKHHLFDAWPDLVFKAFLMAVRTDWVVPSQANLYAPFYLWANAPAQQDFLRSEAFAGVAQAFGRPPVSTWSTIQVQGLDDLHLARFARREVSAIPADVSVATLCQAQVQASRRLMSQPAVVSTVVAFEPTTWTLVRLVFYRQCEGFEVGAGVQHYHVLHLSRPVSDLSPAPQSLPHSPPQTPADDH